MDESTEVMGLCYRREAPYLYGLIQFFRPKEEQSVVGPSRQSTPFVISRSIRGREYVYGSVFELIRELQRLLDDLDRCQVKLESDIRRAGIETQKTSDDSGRIIVTLPNSEDTNEIVYEYERSVTNLLLLLSCQTRNLFEIIPRLDKESVPLRSYEGNSVRENVSIREICDYFVHNRYLFVNGQYIVDVFSDKVKKNSPITQMFMGYKVDWREYVSAIRRAITDVKASDMTGLLRSRLKNLSPDSPHKDVVFLIQNLESFSAILAERIPTPNYGSVLNLLFNEMLDQKMPTIKEKGKVTVTETLEFTAPHIKIHERLDEKKFKINVRCKVTFTSKGRLLDPGQWEAFEREVGYEEFFDCINKVFGRDSLEKP